MSNVQEYWDFDADTPQWTLPKPNFKITNVSFTSTASGDGTKITITPTSNSIGGTRYTIDFNDPAAAEGADEGCGTPIYPYDGVATHTYSYDKTAQTITVNGIGAHLGLARAYNGGEWYQHNNPFDGSAVVESITYTIVEMEATRMTVEIQFQPGGGYWTYVLTKN